MKLNLKSHFTLLPLCVSVLPSLPTATKNSHALSQSQTQPLTHARHERRIVPLQFQIFKDSSTSTCQEHQMIDCPSIFTQPYASNIREIQKQYIAIYPCWHGALLGAHVAHALSPLCFLDLVATPAVGDQTREAGRPGGFDVHSRKSRAAGLPRPMGLLPCPSSQFCALLWRKIITA